MSRGGGARRTGGGARKGGARGTGDKTEAFWDSIDSENVKTLFWSLKYGGFSATKPYDEDNTPPIHYSVKVEKLKSLKCIVESIDRMRSQRDIDFPWEDEDNLTPLMVACQQDWAAGARVLLENGADVAKKDARGKTAKDHATKNESKAVLRLFVEWESDSPEAVMTEAEKAKKAEIIARNKEASQHRAAEQKAAEEELRKKEEEKEKLQEAIKLAAVMAAWPEVREALADVRKELSINKLGPEDGTDIDPSLWKLVTLQVLQLRLKKEALTELPPAMGQLVALTDLNLSHNSLTTLPEEIKELASLKSLSVDSNCLARLPDGLSQCKKLEVVSLVSNQLTSVAPLAPLAASLCIVHLSNNQLPELEIPLEKCTRLGTLTLSSNQLTAVPPKMGTLTKLRVLKMANNQITELPDDMSEMKNLQELDIEGNPFKDKKIMKVIEGRNGVKELRTYLGKGKKK
eukprot:EG_transcript_9330